jgi:hypothetical protein
MHPDRPLFLVGCPRSGTTLLSVLLHAHPRIAMPPETRFLLPVYLERNSYGDLALRDNRYRLARRLTRKGARFPLLGLNRRAVTRSIVKGPPTIGSAMAIVWREFARSRGKARWGEKRPLYAQHLPWVLRLFPDAQIIHLVRDPRACVTSLLDVPWWERGWRSAMFTWGLADHELARFARTAAPDAYHVLRYEDLLLRPRDELTRLCTFLGENFDEQMLQFSDAADDIVPQTKVWHALTRGPLDPSRTERWRTRLPERSVGVIEAALGDAMAHWGYEPSGIGAPVGAAELARYRAGLAARLGSLRAMHVADRVRRLAEKQDVAAQPAALTVARTPRGRSTRTRP